MLNINTDAAVVFTNTLEKLHRSALPVAIRGALNDVAFDVKLKTMPQETNNAFVKREPRFFKANSAVDQATGFNVNTMKSTVGFFENKLSHQSTNYSVKDLEQQEYGGTIKGRTFVPMKQARGSRGLVKPNLRIRQLANVIKATDSKVSKRNAKQRFIRAAIVAKTLNPGAAFMSGNVHNGSKTIFKVEELHTATRGQGSFGSRKLFIKLTPIYRVKNNRALAINKTNFMQRASMGSALRLEDFYIERAKKQIEKYLK